MGKENKIKVEAEVTTNKNVSSGIGKGFGLVIGIFLGLLVLGIFFGILISSRANNEGTYKYTPSNNPLPATDYPSTSVPIKNYQEPIQTTENPTPVPPTSKPEQNQETKPTPNNSTATQNGISISLDNYTFIKKGDDWGKITDMTVTITNNGNDAFHPKVLVVLHDDNDARDEWTQPKAEINFDIWNLAVGEHTTKKVITNIAFNEINLTKRLVLVLTTAYDWDNTALVALDKDIKFN